MPDSGQARKAGTHAEMSKKYQKWQNCTGGTVIAGNLEDCSIDQQTRTRVGNYHTI